MDAMSDLWSSFFLNQRLCSFSLKPNNATTFSKAAKKAIEMSGIDPADIHLVICATSSPDDLFGDAPSIAAAVGCTTRTVAFDLTAACSGFLFGIVTAGMYLENG